MYLRLFYLSFLFCFNYFLSFVFQFAKIRNLFHILQEFLRGHLHLCESEPAFPEVFQRSADMVDGVVDAEETVVDFIVELHLDGLVLGVVLFEVKRKLLLDLLGIDGGRDFRLPLVKHSQHGVVHIVIEDNDALLGRADEVGNKSVGVENLPVEKDALHWRQRGADKEFNLLVMFLDFTFYVGQALIYGITMQKIIFQYDICPLSKLNTPL